MKLTEGQSPSDLRVAVGLGRGQGCFGDRCSAWFAFVVIFCSTLFECLQVVSESASRAS